MSEKERETSFTLRSGGKAFFYVPWTVDEKDLQLCERLFALHVAGIREYRQSVSAREEWWLKNRHLGP